MELNDPKDWMDDDRDPVYREVDDRLPWQDDETVHGEITKLVEQRRLEHHMVASLQQLRKHVGHTQNDAQTWRRPQSEV